MLKAWKHLIIIISIISYSSAYDFDKFEINYKKDIRSLNDTQVRSIVETSLKDILEADPYYKAITHVYSNDRFVPEFLITYLLRSDCLLYESYKISLNIDGSVSNVTSKFEQPVEEDEIRDLECYSCPDPEVEVYIESCMDGAPLGAAEWCYAVASGAGYNTVKDIAAMATTERLKAYLTCPKLKCVIHVGHGNNEKGILLADTDIRHEWFSAQPEGVFDQQVHLYGSCLVQNDPFQSAILHTGVEAFMGGITTINIVTLQNTMYFISMGMFYGKEVKESFLATDAVSHGWGISGNPPNGPWYVDFEETPISMEPNNKPGVVKNLKVNYNKLSKTISIKSEHDFIDGDQLKVDVYTTNGRFVKNAYNGILNSRKKEITFNGKNLANGIYLIKIFSTKGQFKESIPLLIN